MKHYVLYHIASETQEAYNSHSFVSEAASSLPGCREHGSGPSRGALVENFIQDSSCADHSALWFHTVASCKGLITGLKITNGISHLLQGRCFVHLVIMVKPLPNVKS